MWHEARKQERKIRGMIVDYRKRAERRQDFYERIKADPTQFMQIHGRKCKIHLDPAIAAAGDGVAIIVPWQGQVDNLIDRFDVRAHLDYIPTVPKDPETDHMTVEERQCNYERYRILAQNDFLGLSEEKFLNQMYLEEQFGANAQIEAEKNVGKKRQPGGATIGYSYDDPDKTPFSHILNLVPAQHADNDNDESDSDIDMDVSIDISKLDTAQAHELNACGRGYGMLSNDFYSYLTKDADEADALRLAREEEHEKMMLSGRKSRRERRAQKERRVASRPLSPPSYAAKEEPQDIDNANDSDSRSPTPENSGKITYITSFGGEDELQPHTKISINLKKSPKPTMGSLSETATYAQKVKENLGKLKMMNEQNVRKSEPNRKPKQYLRGRSSSSSTSRSRSRNRSRSRCHFRRGRSRSRSRNRGYRKQSKSRSGSRPNRRYRSRTRSRSRCRQRYYSPPKHGRPKSTDKNKPKSKSKSPVRTRIPQVSQSEIRKTFSSKLELATKLVPTHIVPDPAPLKRYYGRKRDNESSENNTDDTEDKNDSDEGDEDDHMDTISNHSTSLASTNPGSSSFSHKSSSGRGKNFGSTYTTSQGTNYSNASNETKTLSCGSSKLNPRERLKRKMQILLNKQYKADKKAETEKTERQLQQQQEREDEMRELALKLRRRQRELRHKYGSPTSSQSRSESENEMEDKQKEETTIRRSSSPLNSVQKKNYNDRHKIVATHERSRSRTRVSSSRRRSRSSSRDSKRGYRQSPPGRRGSSSDRNRDRSRVGRKYERDRSNDRYSNGGRSYSRDRYGGPSRSGRSSKYSDWNIDRRSDRNSDNYTRHKWVDDDKYNRNKVIISAPPKLKKLVDY